MSSTPIRVELIDDKWHVVGGNLPRCLSWAAFDNESDARTEAWETAEALGLEYLPAAATEG